MLCDCGCVINWETIDRKKGTWCEECLYMHEEDYSEHLYSELEKPSFLCNVCNEKLCEYCKSFHHENCNRWTEL